MINSSSSSAGPGLPRQAPGGPSPQRRASGLLGRAVLPPDGSLEADAARCCQPRCAPPCCWLLQAAAALRGPGIKLIAIPVLSLRWKAALPAHGIGTLRRAGDGENCGREERKQHGVREEELAQLRELRGWV